MAHKPQWVRVVAGCGLCFFEVLNNRELKIFFEPTTLDECVSINIVEKNTKLCSRETITRQQKEKEKHTNGGLDWDINARQRQLNTGRSDWDIDTSRTTHLHKTALFGQIRALTRTPTTASLNTATANIPPM